MVDAERGFRSGVLAASTPWLVRSDRPSSIVAPNRNITAKESGAAGDITIVRPAAAAPPRRPEQVEMRRAGFLGHHPPRDKEHQLASRKCRRESTPERRRYRQCCRISQSLSMTP